MEDAVTLPHLPTEKQKNFQYTQLIKEIIFNYFASEVSISKLKDIKKEFIKLDKNGDGILSIEELKSMLKNYPESYIEDVMNRLDKDQSGFIDYHGKI